MKAYSIFLLLLCATSTLLGQSYHRLVDSNAVWSEVIAGLDWSDYNVTDLSGYKFLIEGDTVIQGQHYSLLKFRFTYYYEYKGGFQPWWDAHNINDSLRVIGAIRESSNKKIWFRQFSNEFPGGVFQLNTNILLYDFGLQVGDTFRLDSTTWAIVQSIDSIQLLSGEWRKTFFFSPLGWATSFWIEGIGSNAGLLANYFFPFESGPDLICYHKDEELLYESFEIYPYPNMTCDSLLLGIENPNTAEATFEISPNPSSDFLSINFSSPRLSLRKPEDYECTGTTPFE